VIADDCTGCELCVPACPVDCIALEPMPPGQIDTAHADAARAHFQRREARRAREQEAREAELAARKQSMDAASSSSGTAAPADSPRNAVQQALERARKRRMGQ
jgi:electron transport complex protein RnfB